MSKHFKINTTQEKQEGPPYSADRLVDFDQYALNGMVLNLSNISRKLVILNFIQSLYV